MTEEDLKNYLEKAQNGDTDAFARIYDLFFEKLYKFIFYRVGHKQISEDLLAETFVKAWQKIGQIGNSKALSSWLFQIAKNNIIDYYRSKKTTISLEEVEDFLEEVISPVEELDLNLEQKKILEVIQLLPVEQGLVIKYKFFEDLSNQEIAILLNKTEGAIRVIQHRAVIKLKELINE